jgi:chemotaxis methyl-accepting protein methylase
MTALIGAQDEVFKALEGLACRLAGFDRSAVGQVLLARMVQGLEAEGWSRETLRTMAEEGHPYLAKQLIDALIVGETFFFRQSEHFEYLRAAILPVAGKGVLRALCAGCSSGEEAWSLAGALESWAATQPGASWEVTALDLSASRLATARRGVYGAWSLRDEPPHGLEIFEDRSALPLRVRETLKGKVRFFQHNLLQPLEADWGKFDLVFCRNVLIYLSGEAAAAVLANLESAGRPGAWYFFGPVDRPSAAPKGLERACGTLQVYRKPALPAARPAAWLPPAPAPRVAEPARGPSGAVEQHLAFLHALESGEEGLALAMLGMLQKRHPDYVPGWCERGVLAARRSQPRAAHEAMRHVLTLLEGREAMETLEGPQALSVSYYRLAAQSVMESCWEAL